MMAKPIIVAFDFDKTITRRDSLVPFLFFTRGTIFTLVNLFLLLPIFIAFVFRLKTRQQVKEAVLSRFFRGTSKDRLLEWGQAYSQEILPQKVKPEALNRIKWHQEQGHRCMLISANLDCYLDFWGKAIGFDDIIVSKLAYDENDNFTGKLLGLNCWGPEKARRFLELAGPREGYVLYAYGDSRGDREVLFLADFRFYRKMPVKDS